MLAFNGISGIDDALDRTLRKIIAAICLLIPFGVYFDVPFYNVINPVWAGLPFFYWFQIIMLPISALLFFVAALLIDMK